MGDRRECGRDKPVACGGAEPVVCDGDEPEKPERNDYLFCVRAMGPAFEYVQVNLALAASAVLLLSALWLSRR